LQVGPSLVDAAPLQLRRDDRWVWRRPAVVLQMPDTVIAYITHDDWPNISPASSPHGLCAFTDAACTLYAASVYVTLGCPPVRPSVCMSVCPVDRQQQRHAAGLLLTGYRSKAAGARGRAADGVSAVIRGGGSTQNCSVLAWWWASRRG